MGMSVRPILGGCAEPVQCVGENPHMDSRSLRSLADRASGPRSVARRALILHLRRLLAVGLFVVALLLLGATGLSVSEGVGFWYSFQWALDTAATVGGFPQPHTTAGQIIEVALVLVGVGTLFYALAVVADLFVV